MATLQPARRLLAPKACCHPNLTRSPLQAKTWRNAQRRHEQRCPHPKTTVRAGYMQKKQKSNARPQARPTPSPIARLSSNGLGCSVGDVKHGQSVLCEYYLKTRTLNFHPSATRCIPDKFYALTCSIRIARSFGAPHFASGCRPSPGVLRGSVRR